MFTFHQVTTGNYTCDICKKVCKSWRGLQGQTKSHKNTVEESPLDLSLLNNIICEEKMNFIINECYPEGHRKELEGVDQNQFLSEELLRAFADHFNNLMENGNAERFYSQTYATIALNSNKFLPGINQDVATMLLCKVIDR